MPAPSRACAGTASQRIPGVRQTLERNPPELRLESRKRTGYCRQVVREGTCDKRYGFGLFKPPASLLDWCLPWWCFRHAVGRAPAAPTRSPRSHFLMRLWVGCIPSPSLIAAAARQHRGNSEAANLRPASRSLGMDASRERLPQLAASSFACLSASAAVGREPPFIPAVPTVEITPLPFALDRARRAAEQGHEAGRGALPNRVAGPPGR